MRPTTGPDQLALIRPAATRHDAATDALRLVTWNVQHAAPRRSRDQAAWLADTAAADVAVLTEVGAGPGGEALVHALAEHGYRSILDPHPAGDYRTVIASRHPGLTAREPPVDILAHRAPAAHLIIGTTCVHILGLYVPSRGPKQRRNQDKRAFQNAVTAALPTLVPDNGGLLVVAGDLNVVEPGHRPHYPVFGDWEYAFYEAFTTAGLTDAFRTLHP